MKKLTKPVSKMENVQLLYVVDEYRNGEFYRGHNPCPMAPYYAFGGCTNKC